MFTKEQILADCTNSDSEVYETWMDMATDWLADDPSEYLKDGFKGYNQRTPQEILCDFYLAGNVTNMTEEEFNQMMDHHV